MSENATNNAPEGFVAVNSLYHPFCLMVYSVRIYEGPEAQALGYGVTKNMLEQFWGKLLERKDVCYA